VSRVDLASARRAAPTPGPQASLARELVERALRSCDAALGAWEAGSAAFGRADLHSDLDLGVLCVDGRGAEVLDAIEAELRSVAPELDLWDRPVAEFGSQRFWQVRGDQATAPFCMVDASVMGIDADASSWAELLTPERHGRALVIHDPEGVLERAITAAAFDAAAHRERIAVELDRIVRRRTLFGGFGRKELGRDRQLDAHWIHQAMVLAPLVSLLGMVHRPLRFDFAMRYLHDELPAEVVERLVPITEPGIDGVAAAMELGVAWMDELLAQVEVEALPIEDHAAQMRSSFG